MAGNAKTSVESRVIKAPGPSITWAGESPRGYGYYLGTEEGNLWSADADFNLVGHSKIFVESGSAINGVAFTTDLIAVTTRSEIVLKRGPGPEELFIEATGVYKAGAHGVIATPRGVAASLGLEGLLFVERSAGGDPLMQRVKAGGAEIYFYKIVHLGTARDGRDIYAGAGRDDGLLDIVVDPVGGQGRIIPYTSAGSFLDVVDVCSLQSVLHEFASASLGIDNAIYLSRNFEGDRAPLTLRFDALKGTAYAIGSASDHLFLLTSGHMYTFPGLAGRHLRGDRLLGKIKVNGLHVEASDLSIAYGSDLLLIRADDVVKFEIEPLVKRRGDGSLTELESWETPEIVDAPWMSERDDARELVHV